MTTTKKTLRDLSDYQIIMVLLHANPFDPPKPHRACRPGEYMASQIPQYDADGKETGVIRTFKNGATVTRTEFVPN